MPELNPQIQSVLHDLDDVAMTARLAGGVGERLADDITALAAKYATGQVPDASTTATPVTELAAQDLVEVTDDVADPIDGDDATDDVADPIDGDDATDDVYDPMDALADEINEIGQDFQRAALPQEMTLVLRREDELPLDVESAARAARLVLPSIVEVVGPLELGDPVTADDAVRVPLTVSGDNVGGGLARLGAGQDGFNAAIPLAGTGTILVSSEIGQPQDADLAAELGTLPPDLPDVPEGQHRINGVLTHIENETGYRPQAQREFTVTYTKDSGDELTDGEMGQILAHPISSGPYGLARFGAYQFLETLPGPTPATKVARFVLLADGEIDLATVALVAAAYRGTFDFGGRIGRVTANADAQLVDVEVDAGI